jgi:D-glycero-alpha-D-manno-heptose-7-phosphate kinase
MELAKDAYAYANGGLNVIKFSTDEAVDVSPIRIRISLQDRLNLENSMVLIRVGNTRSASNILSRAHSNKISQLSNIKLLAEMLDLVKTFEESFGTDLVRLGNALTETWALKKAVFPQASNEEIDDVVMRGLRAGALGAKLLGAGGSGFVLFLVPPDLRSMFLEHFPGRNNQTVSLE